jgi:hypothetical protein
MLKSACLVQGSDIDKSTNYHINLLSMVYISMKPEGKSISAGGG